MIDTGKKRFSDFVKEHSIIIGILLLALILRCYNLFSIPYTHDELSGLLRTRFDSFGELIAKGVQVDGHPAFVQVFLYYWTGLFGTSEWIVKLPFILSGVGGVYFAYKIGKRWSNVTVGLIVAAILATSQYPIMYSQIARPYTSGFFFTLLFAYHWGEIVFFKNYARNHLIWFPIAAALCAYNHHFSMLTAGLIGLFGIVYTYKDYLWKYLLLCLAAVILYSPHFTILSAQLKMGGLSGWLGKPEPSFLPHYIEYIFQFSSALLVIYTIIIIWTRISGKSVKRNSKAILFSGILFLSVYFTGYYYSILVAPVLQTSVLIFAYPFLLLFLFGWAKEQSKGMNLMLVLAIVLVNCFVLIFQRQHYTVFYKTPFKDLFTGIDYLPPKELGHKPSFTLIFSDEPKTRFYVEKGELQIPEPHLFFTVPEFTEKDLEAFLEKHSNLDEFYLAATSSLPPAYRAIILQKYPQIIWQKNYFSASTLFLAKGKPSEKPIADITRNKNLFNGYNPGKWYDGAYHFEKDEEWGPGYSKPLEELIKRPSDLVDVVVTLKLSDLKQDPLLVLNVQSNDSIIHYLSSAVSQHTVNLKDSTVTLVQSIKFIDLNYRKFDKPFLNTYIWNRDKKPLKIVSFQVIYRKDNPLTYGLYEPIFN